MYSDNEEQYFQVLRELATTDPLCGCPSTQEIKDSLLNAEHYLNIKRSLLGLGALDIVQGDSDGTEY